MVHENQSNPRASLLRQLAAERAARKLPESILIQLRAHAVVDTLHVAERLEARLLQLLECADTALPAAFVSVVVRARDRFRRALEDYSAAIEHLARSVDGLGGAVPAVARPIVAGPGGDMAKPGGRAASRPGLQPPPAPETRPKDRGEPGWRGR